MGEVGDKACLVCARGDRNRSLDGLVSHIQGPAASDDIVQCCHEVGEDAVDLVKAGHHTDHVRARVREFLCQDNCEEGREGLELSACALLAKMLIGLTSRATSSDGPFPVLISTMAREKRDRVCDYAMQRQCSSLVTRRQLDMQLSHHLPASGADHQL